MKQRNRGRILRVKLGYNPNSSSVGSLIPAFLAFATGAAALTVLAANGFNAIDKHIREKQKDLTSEAKYVKSPESTHNPHGNSFTCQIISNCNFNNLI